MRPRDYTILARAVEEGVAMGWNRAYKHTERPELDDAINTITDGVLNAITEVFEFDEGSEYAEGLVTSSDDLYRGV